MWRQKQVHHGDRQNAFMSNKVHFSWSVTHKKPSHPVTQFITKWHFCHSFCIFMPTDTEAATWCFFFWNKNQHMSSDPDRAIEQLCKKIWKSWLTVWRAYSAFFRYSWHWPCRTMALWWMALRLEPLQGAAEGTHHHFIIKQPHYHSLDQGILTLFVLCDHFKWRRVYLQTLVTCCTC